MLYALENWTVHNFNFKTAAIKFRKKDLKQKQEKLLPFSDEELRTKIKVKKEE